MAFVYSAIFVSVSLCELFWNVEILPSFGHKKNIVCWAFWERIVYNVITCLLEYAEIDIVVFWNDLRFKCLNALCYFY
jgi:hypothetical protein